MVTAELVNQASVMGQESQGDTGRKQGWCEKLAGKSSLTPLQVPCREPESTVPGFQEAPVKCNPL